MSLTDSISGDLQAMGAGVSAAQQEAAAVNSAVEQVAARAAAAGFAGIAVGLARVREVVGQVRARLTTAGGVLGEASRSVAAVPQQPSPQETISVLTPVVAALSTVDSAVAAAAAGIEEARRLAAATLQGGQPGPTLARLQQLGQTLAAVKTRGGGARQHVEAALAQARQVGDLGN
ncbi:DUF6244 family protein [Micromonospora echinofusca]|uniref:Uncharacterized protein n=1 Tax=Micromonospora echinofusca TaxID=47858 RepID=A0ABS3VJX8_MICEH|nr:DUF6244 family protein [Micromonospora echinofusca]MBO4204776.1 hypothetical protein [Micromonospora echinofusca]